jgi:3',5'-cyclic AMP phosphodiesterase CpdA
MDKTVTIFHISDLHFGDEVMNFTRLRESGGIFSKQLPGLINYLYFRQKKFLPEIRVALLEYLQNSDWDYLIISGDLTTLSLHSEFQLARAALEPLIKKGPVLLTTGNHDCYTLKAEREGVIKKYFGDLFPFNLTTEVKSYPLPHNYILYEIDQAIHQHIFSSQGEVRVSLSNLAQQMSQLKPELKKIVLGHYPAFFPTDISEKNNHQLKKRHLLKRFLVENDVRLYLHGHMHKSWNYIPNEAPALNNVNSGGCCRYGQGRWAGFHRITLSESGHTVERVKLVL